MNKSFRTWMRGLPVLFLLPYLITILFNGSYTALVGRLPDEEEFLPMLTATQISPHNEPEMVKTQSIVARTNFYRKLKNGVSIREILSEVKEKMTYTYKDFLFYGKIYEDGVRATKDQVLTWKGELPLVPYHEISCGITRDGAETFHNEAYTYLKSVDSSADKDAPGYIDSIYISASQMPRELKITERDSAGYITGLRADGRLLEGEAFRQGMGLASSHFSIQKVGERYRFLSKGKGHGLGISRFGGNMLAKDGAKYNEILEIYFPELKLTDIHSIFTQK